MSAYAWGRNSSVRSLRSRDLACFDYQNYSQHIHTAPCGATSALADAFLCLLLPNDIRVLFPEKALFLSEEVPRMALRVLRPKSPHFED